MLLGIQCGAKEAISRVNINFLSFALHPSLFNQEIEVRKSNDTIFTLDILNQVQICIEDKYKFL